MNKYLIDVNIADDHRLVCEGITDLINQSGQAHVSRCFTTLDACRQALTDRRPDVLLLDLSMPDGDGIAFCQQMIQTYPKMKIIALTIHDEYSMIQRMMDCGAHGYVLKSSTGDDLMQAISSVWQGRKYVSPLVDDILRDGLANSVPLTDVEKRILHLLCDGLTNPQIAASLHLSTETVSWYRKRLLAKFGVKNTVGLVRVALEQRLVI